MKNATATKISKPKNVLRKSIQLDLRGFTTAALKAGSHIILGKWDELPIDAVDALQALGLDTGPEEYAWILLARSLSVAVEALWKEQTEVPPVKEDPMALGKLVMDMLSQEAVTVGRSFFDRPEDSAIAKEAGERFKKWLSNRGISTPAANSISSRFPAYFAASLHDEWTKTHQYSVLAETLASPFLQANERIQRWSSYASSLVKQVDEPMFKESFSLRQVFIEPRAYFNKRLERSEETGLTIGKSTIRVVVDLLRELDRWIECGDKEDAIRLISGGPGSGKSSFAKMFAAHMVRKAGVKVVFVPLHHFEPTSDLIDGLQRFLDADVYRLENPLRPENRTGRLLLIFDGLDELSMQGRIAEKVAIDFIREIQRKIERLNHQEVFLQVLVSGRELVIQQSEADFRKEGQILHILPYFIDPDFLDAYYDPEDALLFDQRDDWWRKYGKVSGLSYDSMPRELARDNLTEITSQPLLNYLVALSLRRGKLNFTEETNLNSIYADLLKAIYERGWSKSQHTAIQGLDERDFTRILEEIALAVWHGDGRKTTIREINTFCQVGGLGDVLNRFQSALEIDYRTKVTQLLAAFYFRQSGQDYTGEKTFEFTHKSFGEYLTARRLVREISLINKKMVAHRSDPDEGWNERECLIRWLKVTGKTTIDNYLYKFVIDEVLLCYRNNPMAAQEVQKVFCHLIGFVLRYGYPVELLSPRPNFQEECLVTRNAEEALLIGLYVFSLVSGVRSEIDWPAPRSLGDWLNRLIGQPAEWEERLPLRCLANMNLTGCRLNSRSLYMADFRNSVLDGAMLVGSDIRYSRIGDARFVGAHLAYANLHGTSFANINARGANFSGALFTVVASEGDGAEFRPDKLLTVDFTNAILSASDFSTCDLRKAKFNNAHLEGAKFCGSDLTEANFSGSTLIGADFSFCRLEGAQFDNADLEGANFHGTCLDPNARQ